MYNLPQDTVRVHMRGATPLPRPIGPPPSSKGEMAALPGPPGADVAHNMMAQMMWPTANATPVRLSCRLHMMLPPVPSALPPSPLEEALCSLGRLIQLTV